MGTAAEVEIQARSAGTPFVDGFDTLNVVSSTGTTVAFAESSPGKLSLTAPTGSASHQPLDAELTEIAGLSPSNDDMMQYDNNAWVTRTLTDLMEKLRVASASAKGIIDTIAQQFAGLKDFADGLAASSIAVYDQNGIGTFTTPTATSGEEWEVPDNDGEVLLAESVASMCLVSIFALAGPASQAIRWFVPFISSTAYTGYPTTPSWRAPRDGHLHAFTAGLGANSYTGTITFKVYIDGVATALSLGIGTGVRYAADLTTEVSISQGQTVHFVKEAHSVSGTFGAHCLQVYFR